MLLDVIHFAPPAKAVFLVPFQFWSTKSGVGFLERLCPSFSYQFVMGFHSLSNAQKSLTQFLDFFHRMFFHM